MEDIDIDEQVNDIPIFCPPSIRIELWDRIPDGQKQYFIEQTALQLRRGIHPEATVIRLLDEMNSR